MIVVSYEDSAVIVLLWIFYTLLCAAMQLLYATILRWGYTSKFCNIICQKNSFKCIPHILIKPRISVSVGKEWTGISQETLSGIRPSISFKIRGCMITYGDTLHKNYTSTHPEDRKQASWGQD